MHIAKLLSDYVQNIIVKKCLTELFQCPPLIVYVLSGIAKHLEPQIRVKAHVLRREHPIFYSSGSLKMAISIELEFKRTLFL